MALRFLSIKKPRFLKVKAGFLYISPENHLDLEGISICTFIWIGLLARGLFDSSHLPDQKLTSGICEVRLHLQWRARNGFSPFSLLCRNGIQTLNFYFI